MKSVTLALLSKPMTAGQMPVEHWETICSLFRLDKRTKCFFIPRTRPKGIRGFAWLGLVSAWNPYKLSIGSLMFADNDERAMFDSASLWAERNKQLRGADRDRLSLETMGAW